jgi:hypothetical protein
MDAVVQAAALGDRFDAPFHGLAVQLEAAQMDLVRVSTATLHTDVSHDFLL